MQKLLLTLAISALGIQSAHGAICQKPEVDHYTFEKYYKSTAGKQGVKLRETLNQIIASNYHSQSYSCVWSMLEEADEDPNNQDNVILIYNQKSYPKSARSGTTYPGAKWNREHLWPKSHGFPNKDQYAYTDGHHLRASDEKCNARRGNMDFGDGGTFIDSCNSYTVHNQTWEPPYQNKGDIARALFYMAVRYEGDSTSKTPNLNLADNITSTKTPLLGKLCELYKWHQEDPVDSKEIERNNIIYSWQGNRNPFIDNPDWVQSIWGVNCPQL